MLILLVVLFFVVAQMSRARGIVVSGGGKVTMSGSSSVTTVNGKTVTELHTGVTSGNEAERYGVFEDEKGRWYVGVGGVGKFEVDAGFQPGTVTRVAEADLAQTPFVAEAVNNGVEFDQPLACVESFVKGPKVFRIRTASGVYRVQANRVFASGTPFCVDGRLHEVGHKKEDEWFKCGSFWTVASEMAKVAVIIEVLHLAREFLFRRD